ncbi:sulfatase-like hydrolase/transferase [Maribacter sp. 2210JD10-5]|uniref:sulfatase-like hydrolase/transferase n=1 Tax=Maribacter sp. 2210JD10-5 TaxID=3386272 RepID=UPI0039BC6A36
MIAFFGCLVVLSLIQYSILYAKGIVESILTESFGLSLLHNLGYTALLGIILVFTFNFWESLRPKYGFRIIILLLSILLIIEAILISYYCVTLVPLGSDLMGYSFADIKATIANSGGLSIGLYLLAGIAILISLFLVFYKITSKLYHVVSGMYPLTIVFFSLFVATLFTEGKPINQNKTQYLAVNLYNSYTDNNDYVADVEYPLIKDVDSENVLGAYFELKPEKPNIVFIIVEGLGRDFMGEGAEFGGFTPYLDSLSTQSLYFENFLSNTGRTFGVLPSLIGSLPFGKSGFMELEEPPNKLTLYGILKQNGYHTSFYQGTNSSFDNVDNFLMGEKVDFVLDRSGFGKNYTLQEEDAAGSSWGYPDKELFKKSMSFKRAQEQPRMEVYMTISNHEPFIPPAWAYYENKVEELVSKGDFNDRTKRIITKNDNVFGSLLYTDESIAWVMNAYRTQPNYNNTIFIITGDHRLIPIPQESTLSRFHVPLLIYSPMLKSGKKISSVSSHFDVVPSLLALLKDNYQLQMPQKVAWMGDGLDMQEAFRSTKQIPLMRNKNELKEFISGDYLYTDGEVLQLNEDMHLNSTLTASDAIASKFNAFKAMNSYVTQENKIIPDSLAIFKLEKEAFTESEIVWINSVSNGRNYDNAYLTARELAFEKDYDKALLLSRYILSEIPSHIDTKILMGRINAWNGNYEESISILKSCISMNPNYIDSYAALFDVYFWSDSYKEAYVLIDTVEENSSDAAILKDKISRARKQYMKASAVETEEKISVISPETPESTQIVSNQ